MADDSYYRLFSEFRKRDNFEEVFRAALEDVACKVDLSRVKSCVAFGTGGGENEMEFARRLLPNLRSFTAVEKDPDAVKALRANFREGKLLPGVVETSAVEASIESWSGLDNKVDAVLFINVLVHIQPADRKVLLHKLITQHLSDGGIVAFSDQSDFPPVLKQLVGRPSCYDKVDEELLEAGFRVVVKQDFEMRRDLSNPSDGVVKFVQLTSGSSESEARSAIDDVHGQPNKPVLVNRLSIYSK